MVKFSVVVPCHNPHPGQLERCLAGVSSQLDLRHHELLLVDDFSADPSVCERAAERHGARLARTTHEVWGCVATNMGITYATGDLVHVVHPDDGVTRGFYGTVADAYRKLPGRALYATGHVDVDEAGVPFDVPATDWLDSEGGFQPLHRGNPLAVAACCVTLAHYREVGGWCPELIHVADWHAWARATAMGGAVQIKWPMCWYRHHPANHTSRLRRTAENFRDYQRLAVKASEFMDVDTTLFREYVRRRATQQLKWFRALGDAEAVAANEAFLRELEAGDLPAELPST